MGELLHAFRSRGRGPPARFKSPYRVPRRLYDCLSYVEPHAEDSKEKQRPRGVGVERVGHPRVHEVKRHARTRAEVSYYRRFQTRNR